MSIKHRGFTIVELLIVIVVIAILAAIGIVAYGGVQERARSSAMHAELRNMHGPLQEHAIINGLAPTLSMMKQVIDGTMHETPEGLGFAVCSSSTERWAIVDARDESRPENGGYRYIGSSGSGVYTSNFSLGTICSELAGQDFAQARTRWYRDL